MFKTLLLSLTLCVLPFTEKPATLQPHPPAGASKIQVALLLDTSNSMDGLIDQAKSQLWKMVNRLADAQRQNTGVELEIALYEYGNTGIREHKGFIRMVQPMGRDLDGLSENLFKLRTNGGDEYCGWVIGDAVDQLSWSTGSNDLRVIVIAGNEPFDQGPVDFRESCRRAAAKGIVINTVFCGDYDEGVKTYWQEGGACNKGKYMNIDTDEKVVHVPTPYDSTVLQLNERLNKTYLGYGHHRNEMKTRQLVQDQNAALYGTSNAVSRANAKAKSSYKNTDWDLVDAAEADEKVLDKLEKEELPEELQNKTPEERKAELERLKAERTAIQKDLRDLEQKIDAYVLEEKKKSGDTKTLDNVLIETVVEQAKACGFEFPKQ